MGLVREGTFWSADIAIGSPGSSYWKESGGLKSEPEPMLNAAEFVEVKPSFGDVEEFLLCETLQSSASGLLEYPVKFSQSTIVYCFFPSCLNTAWR